MIQGPVFAYSIVGRDRRFQGAPIEMDAFHLLLLDRGGIPSGALEAPLASWILARLTAEAGLGGTYADFAQETDGGCFSLKLEAFRDGEASVGGFEILGYSWCAELFGRCRGVEPQALVDDFVGLLLAKARHVSRCRATVRDLEWNDRPDEYRPHRPADTDRNVYGWNGEIYLGRDNFWLESEVGRSWPGDNFRAYHDSVLRDHRASLAARRPEPDVTRVAEEEDDDRTDDVVAAARVELREALADDPTQGVRLRVYDLDGHLTQSETLPGDTVLARVVSWLWQGFDAAWQVHDGTMLVKIWEYPASEPPWSSVVDNAPYEPKIEP